MGRPVVYCICGKFKITPNKPSCLCRAVFLLTKRRPFYSFLGRFYTWVGGVALSFRYTKEYKTAVSTNSCTAYPEF